MYYSHTVEKWSIQEKLFIVLLKILHIWSLILNHFQLHFSSDCINIIFCAKRMVMRHFLKYVHHNCLLGFLPSHWHHIIRFKFFFLFFIMENFEQIQKQQNRIMNRSSVYPSPNSHQPPLTHFYSFICLLLSCIILKQMSDISFHMTHQSDMSEILFIHKSFSMYL